jgi:hypothetical protein
MISSVQLTSMAAPAAECGFTLSRLPDARPLGRFGGSGNAHAGIDFSHWNTHVCFKRVFE